jgi:hypothetical protein
MIQRIDLKLKSISDVEFINKINCCNYTQKNKFELKLIYNYFRQLTLQQGLKTIKAGEMKSIGKTNVFTLF